MKKRTDFHIRNGFRLIAVLVIILLGVGSAGAGVGGCRQSQADDAVFSHLKGEAGLNASSQSGHPPEALHASCTSRPQNNRLPIEATFSSAPREVSETSLTWAFWAVDPSRDYGSLTAVSPASVQAVRRFPSPAVARCILYCCFLC